MWGKKQLFKGSFGDIKQDMQFRRYLSKGTANVLAESTLLAIARNINKLHNKIQNGKTGTHLFPLKRDNIQTLYPILTRLLDKVIVIFSTPPYLGNCFRINKIFITFTA